MDCQENNRKRYKQEPRLLEHIDIEVNGEMMSWDDFNDNVGSRILTMHRNVDNVFGTVQKDSLFF